MHSLVKGTMFLSFPHQGNATQLIQYINDTIVISPEQLKQISAQYNPTKFKSSRYASASWWAASGLLGDAEMTCAAQRTARWAVKSNEKIPVSGRASVFLYFFQHKLLAVDLIEEANHKPLGVFHGSELVLVFGIDELLVTPRERELSRQVGGNDCVSREYYLLYIYNYHQLYYHPLCFVSHVNIECNFILFY